MSDARDDKRGADDLRGAAIKALRRFDWMNENQKAPIAGTISFMTAMEELRAALESAPSHVAEKPADPSGDLMILRMALGNTATCLGDALATYNRFVGEEVFKNAAPQPADRQGNDGARQSGESPQAAGVAPVSVASTTPRKSDRLLGRMIQAWFGKEQRDDPVPTRDSHEKEFFERMGRVYDVMARASEGTSVSATPRNAARYEWLRAHMRWSEDTLSELWFDACIELDPEIAAELDKAIDKAMNRADGGKQT